MLSGESFRVAVTVACLIGHLTTLIHIHVGTMMARDFEICVHRYAVLSAYESHGNRLLDVSRS